MLHLGGARQRALLTILLLHANEVVSNDRLIDDLWGQRPPETAASALRVHVAQLRKVLSDGAGSEQMLITRSPGYLMQVVPDQLDLHRFERLFDQGSHALDDGSWAEASLALRRALDLWRGPALADVAGELFAGDAIVRLEELRLRAIEKRIEADLALGKHSDLIGELAVLVAEHGLRELFHGQLMLALYRSGRQAEALTAYREARRMLVEELGIDPSPVLQRLEREILRQDPALELPDVPGMHADVDAAEAMRPVTVLVAGVRSVEEKEDTELSDEALAVVVDAVLGQGGRIEGFAKQDTVALFGAPTAAEDDPERALLAALAIRDRVSAFGLEARIGVCAGDVRHSVTQLAERLRIYARPGQILASPSMHRLTRLSFDFSPVRLPSRGTTVARIASYEVRQRLARPQKARGIEGLRADMRGRDSELVVLGDALDNAVAGSGRMVVVGGEAGVGKSRLVAELRTTSVAERLGVRWLEGRCRASGGATSYLPYVELLSEHFSWVPEDDDREREKGIVSSVLELVRIGHLHEERVGDVVARLASLLSVRLASDRPDPFANLEPEQLRNMTFAAVKDYVVALARERPLVLVLEDFHWADALSLDLTAHLMDVVSEARIMVLCVSRPDPLHRWRRLTTLAGQKCGPAYRQLELQELSRRDTVELLHALLPVENLSSKVEDLILGAAQGNPFFLEEILQSLIDSRAVYQEAGKWRTGAEIETLKVPESIETVIVSRVDRLDPGAQRVLQTASVIGRSFRRRVLARVAGEGEDFDRALWELESRVLVYEDRVIPEEEFSFKHVLTQEAIYRSLPEDQRAVLHERTGDAIEGLYADGLEEHYEQLAFHFDRSVNAAKAVDYLVKAGEKSRRLYLNADAIDYLQDALRRLEEAPTHRMRAGRVLQASIRERLGDVLRLTGRHQEAIGSYERARALLTKRDGLEQARLHRKLASTYHLQRRIEEANVALDRAERVLGRPSRDAPESWWEERVEIELKRLWLDYFFGTDDLPAEMVDAARALVEENGTADQRGRIFNLLAAVGLRRDRAAPGVETLGYARAALEAGEESGDIGAVAQGHQVVGFCLLWAWELDESERELSQALAVAERVGDVTLLLRTLPYLTLVRRRLGAVDDVRGLAKRTLALAEAGHMDEYVAQAKANQAWVAWRCGEIDMAEQEANAAWEIWRRIPGSLYRMLDWIVVWPLLGVALHRDQLTEAVQHVRDLVDPSRQPMPEDLKAPLHAALAAWDGRQPDAARVLLQSAASVASGYGYL